MYNIINDIKKGDARMIFQLGSALLDACVLAVLSEEDAYG